MMVETKAPRSLWPSRGAKTLNCFLAISKKFIEIDAENGLESPPVTIRPPVDVCVCVFTQPN